MQKLNIYLFWGKNRSLTQNYNKNLSISNTTPLFMLILTNIKNNIRMRIFLQLKSKFTVQSMQSNGLKGANKMSKDQLSCITKKIKINWEGLWGHRRTLIRSLRSHPRSSINCRDMKCLYLQNEPHLIKSMGKSIRETPWLPKLINKANMYQNLTYCSHLRYLQTKR